MHPFVQFVAVVWICATIGSRFTKDSQCFGAAAFVTFAAGIGYLILRYNHC